MLLVYLQLFTVSLALTMGIHPWTWIGEWMCKIPGLGDAGVCECNNEVDEKMHTCWINETLFRAQAAGFVVFVAVGLMAVSGCSDSAAHSWPALKFMLVLCFAVVFTLVPNGVFNFYADFANIMSTIFIAAQAILLIDFGYTWNETWMGNSVEARRRDIVSHGGYRNWKVGILVASALLFLGSLTMCIMLWVNFDHGAWVVIIAVLMSVGLGFVSILDSVKHGNLLTSCVVFAYASWLSFEALLAHPDNTNQRPTFLKWFGIGIAFVSLVAAAFGTGLGFNKATETLVEFGSAQEAGAAAPTPEAVEDGEVVHRAAPQDEGGPFDKRGFLIDSAIHAAAVLYITVEIAPRHSLTAFTCRTLGMILALCLYGWTLAAPLILSGRSF